MTDEQAVNFAVFWAIVMGAIFVGGFLLSLWVSRCRHNWHFDDMYKSTMCRNCWVSKR